MVRRLEAKGFKREQAEEIISVVKDVQNELATRQDINDLKKEIKQETEKTKGEMKNLELRITIQTLCKWWKLYTEKGITTAIKPEFERKRR
jgi:hypothetical protein